VETIRETELFSLRHSTIEEWERKEMRRRWTYFMGCIDPVRLLRSSVDQITASAALNSLGRLQEISALIPSIPGKDEMRIHMAQYLLREKEFPTSCTVIVFTEQSENASSLKKMNERIEIARKEMKESRLFPSHDLILSQIEKVILRSVKPGMWYHVFGQVIDHMRHPPVTRKRPRDDQQQEYEQEEIGNFAYLEKALLRFERKKADPIVFSGDIIETRSSVHLIDIDGRKVWTIICHAANAHPKEEISLQSAIIRVHTPGDTKNPLLIRETPLDVTLPPTASPRDSGDEDDDLTKNQKHGMVTFGFRLQDFPIDKVPQVQILWKLKFRHSSMTDSVDVPII
jgi:hypothetical protein